MLDSVCELLHILLIWTTQKEKSWKCSLVYQRGRYFPLLEQLLLLEVCPTSLAFFCEASCSRAYKQTAAELSTLKNLFIIQKVGGAVTCSCVLLYEDLNDADISLLSQ